MMRPFFLCLIFVLLFCTQAFGWTAEIVAVYDGDTIHVKAPDCDDITRIRLYGIDAPEFAAFGWKSQPMAEEARLFLSDMLPAGLQVTVHDMYLDKYGRTVGSIISLPDGAIAQEELLKAGLVWVYSRYCNGCQQWQELEEKARINGAGLWSEPGHMPPWEWRSRARASQAKKKKGL